MPKRLLVFCVVLTVAGFVSAAPAPYLLTNSSLLSQTSFGLFTNAFDAAFNESDAGAQPTFSTLTPSYIFSGLANDFSRLVGDLTPSPLTFGFYSSGAQPWSAFGDLYFQTAASNLNDGTTVTLAGTKSPGDGTTYSWDRQTQANTYAFHEAWNAEGNDQFLVKMGGLNLGAVVNWYFLQNTTGLPLNSGWMPINLSQHFVFNYDTAAAGVAPAPAQNYTEDVAKSMPDATFDIGLAAPLFFKVGSIGFDLAPKVEYNRHDASVANSQTYTVPQAAGAGSFVIPAGANNATTDVTGWMSVSLTSTASLPSLIGGNEKNQTLINLDGNITFNTADPKHVVANLNPETWNYAGGGAAFTYPVGSVNLTDTTTTRAGGIGFRIAPSAQQSLYIDLGSGTTWAIGPKVDVDVSFAPAAATYRTQSTVVSKVDGNGNGTFTDAADTIVTTVITYNHNNEGGTWTTIGGIELPTALTFRPSGSFFGITVGASPRLLYTLTSVSSTPETSSQAISATDGTGAAIAVPGGITTVNAANSSPATSVTSGWTIDAHLALSIDFYLPSDAILQVKWTGAGGLAFQGTIPLTGPRPKGEGDAPPSPGLRGPAAL